MVSHLCSIAEVSKSGYYRYWSPDAMDKRKQREQEDEKVKEKILKAFHFKGRKKGARSIKMPLAGQFKIVYNLKRIGRIMRKYGIACPIRKSNPYKRMMKATLEHRVVPNLLNREFKQDTPFKVLLTDITYLYYGAGKKAFLSTIKDSSTNEILAHHVSDRITMDLA
ncbi:MAG: family transposase, partial [Paenibacillaceae bacterium]|nr:family transposase [Paenibacillaceae bacterium]